MHRLKQNVRWLSLIVVSLAVVAGEAWRLGQEQRLTQRLGVELLERKQERERLCRQTPALTDASERAIEHELELAADKVKERRTGLFLSESPATPQPAPGRPIDAYFEIAGFVERMRAAAAGAEVQIRPDECFGFTTHRSGGSPIELVPVVVRQRAMLESLIGILFEAHPRALLSVRREAPGWVRARAQRARTGLAERGTKAASPTDGDATDFFHPMEKISLAAPGELFAQAFRLEFSGSTETLRNYLNRLADSPLAIAVRSVEAAPMVEATSAPETGRGKNNSRMIAVGHEFSRFAVVIEFIEPVVAS